MKSLRLFLWNYLFKHLPGYTLRRFVFTRVMANEAPGTAAIHRDIDLWGVGGIRLGAYCTMNKYASLDGRGGLTVGDRVSISAYVKILTSSHLMNSSTFEVVEKPVVIEDYVWVGTGAIILPGVILGKGSVVAAGSVVTGNVEAYHIVGGNPAKFIGKRSDLLDYKPYWTPISE